MISYSKVRALTRVAKVETQTELLLCAESMSGGQLEQVCRKLRIVQTDPGKAKDEPLRRFVERRDLDDGMVRITAVVTADEAALVFAALDKLATEQMRTPPTTPDTHGNVPAETRHHHSASPTPLAEHAHSDSCHCTPAADVSAETRPTPNAAISRDVATKSVVARPRRFDRADALVALVEAVARGERPDRSPLEVVLTIPIASLLDGSAAPGMFSDGSAVSTAAARRLACDSALRNLVEGAEGTTLDVGRKYRRVTKAIARALEKRDPVCQFPGCTNRLFLQDHHIEHWIDGGATKLSNLVRLCTHHHKCVHEYGFTITVANDNKLRFFDPRGRLLVAAPALPAPIAPALAALPHRRSPRRSSSGRPRPTRDRTRPTLDRPSRTDRGARIRRRFRDDPNERRLDAFEAAEAELAAHSCMSQAQPTDTRD